MEGHFVSVGVKAGWIIGACFVKEEEVEEGGGKNYEGEKKVECKESGEGGVIN